MKNVVICLVDALRYDALPDQRDRGTLAELGVDDQLNTPGIERLITAGTVLPELHTTYGSTPPAVTSLLTGLYPREHKVYDYYRPMDPGVKTMPDFFSEKGYRTISFNGHALFEVMGLESRFDECRKGPAKKLIETIKDYNNQGENVFAYYHTFDVHEPYTLSRYPRDQRQHQVAVDFANRVLEECGEDTRFVLDDAVNYVQGDGYTVEGDDSLPVFEFFIESIHETFERGSKIFDDTLNVMAQLYVQGINLFDAYQLNDLVDFLFDSESGEETLFLFTSDHGEVIQESDNHTGLKKLGHQGPPTEELIKVPGILVNSDLNHATVDEWEITSLVDLLPTLLNEASIEHETSNFSGRDLSRTPPDEFYVFADYCKTELSVGGTGEKRMETVFPLPAVLSWHTILSSDGLKFYRKGLELRDEDYDYPLDKFIRIVYAKLAFEWLSDEEIKEVEETLDTGDIEEIKQELVEQVKNEYTQDEGVGLFNWKEDWFETVNLLNEEDTKYKETAEELNQILVDRFRDPIHFEEPEINHNEVENDDEVAEQLDGLGYL